MKFLFNINFFLLLIFFTNCVLSKDIKINLVESYDIEFGGVDIGRLNFQYLDSPKEYKISINIQDKGFFSGLYKFRGSYDVIGERENDLFYPLNYNQDWKTKKKNSIINIVFKNGFLRSLKISPEEKELARVNYVELEGHLDPISSFFSILRGAQKVSTVDGRRIYSMNVVDSKIVEKRIYKKIEIQNYVNIWADHKRKNLRYIEVVQSLESESLEMPLIIKIKLNNFLIKLKKN